MMPRIWEPPDPQGTAHPTWLARWHGQPTALSSQRICAAERRRKGLPAPGRSTWWGWAQLGSICSVLSPFWALRSRAPNWVHYATQASL